MISFTFQNFTAVLFNSKHFLYWIQIWLIWVSSNTLLELLVFSHELCRYVICILFRYYKKAAVVKEKQKRSADENSIEDVDDEEFEEMIGNLFLLT